MSALPKFEDDRRNRAELHHALGAMHGELVAARRERDDARAEVGKSIAVLARAKDEIASLQDDLRLAQENHATEIARLSMRLHWSEQTAKGLAAQIGELAAAKAAFVELEASRLARHETRARQRFTVTDAGTEQAARDDRQAEVMGEVA